MGRLMEQMTETTKLSGDGLVNCMKARYVRRLPSNDEYVIGPAVDRLATYERAMSPDRAKELAEAEKAGKLMVLPCKTGDTIYQLQGKGTKQGPRIVPRVVLYVGVWRQDYTVFHLGPAPCHRSQLGKTWFLTLPEAEAALEKLKEK